MEFRPLKAEEIDCRVSQIASNWLTLLLYKDARCDMNILDETVGIMNWKKDYQLIDGQLFCTISIWDEEKKQWVGKQDVGIESFSQEEKGRASDAQKRSAFCFGIGRELYTAPSIFILPRKDMVKKGKDNEFYDKGNGKYETKTRFYVEYIDYDDNRNIQNIIIRDNKNNIRFSELTKTKEKELLDNQLKMKKLIELKEEKDTKFQRENLYKYFGVEADSQLTNKQVLEVISMLGKKEDK